MCSTQAGYHTSMKKWHGHHDLRITCKSRASRCRNEKMMKASVKVQGSKISRTRPVFQMPTAVMTIINAGSLWRPRITQSFLVEVQDHPRLPVDKHHRDRAPPRPIRLSKSRTNRSNWVPETIFRLLPNDRRKSQIEVIQFQKKPREVKRIETTQIR